MNTAQFNPEDPQIRRRSKKEISTLEKLENTLAGKEEDYVQWLVKNWNHPDRTKIISDRNNNLVKLHTTRVKLINLRNGEPMLGSDMGMDVSRIIQEQGKNK